MKLIKKCYVLPAVCVGLAWFGAGCDSSSVNESGSTGATGGTAVAPPKDAPPPPKSVKDYYERTQGANAAKNATPTPKGATK